MLSDLLHRMRALVSRRVVEREIDDELRYHLDRQVEAYEQRGLSRAEAVRRARLDFGGGLEQIKEEYRDSLGVRLVDDLRRDVRTAMRSLRATPMITAVAILSLALTIGANAAIFSVLNALVLRTLPVRDPARLVHVTDLVPRPPSEGGETRVRAWSAPAWERIRQRPFLYESASAWSFVQFNLASGGETQFVEGMWADGGFFETLGLQAQVGRTFSRSDDQRGGGPDGPVTVISYRYWQRQYAATPDIIGRSVRLNGVPFTIVGVTPPEFFGPEVGRSFDFIVPLQTETLIRGADSRLDEDASNFLTIVARLRPDHTIESAAQHLLAVQDDIMPASNRAASLTMVPAATGASNLRLAYIRPLRFLSAIVGLVMLVGCVNIANLLLARTMGRRHELTVRLALGASRGRVIRQLFAESVILATVGAALGIALANYLGQVLVTQLSSSINPVFLHVPIDVRVLSFTALVTMITALLFGTMPAIWASRAEPSDTLKGHGRISDDRAQRRFMGSLVIVQVALSVTLVVAAGLFVRSFIWLTTRPLGFSAAPVMVVTIDGQRAVPNPEMRLGVYQQTRDVAATVPNVAAAAISFLTPMGRGGFTPPVRIAPDPRSPNQQEREIGANGNLFGNLVSPGFFATLGTPLLAGRDFTEQDRRGAPRVVMVNERFVRELLGGSHAIGRVVHFFPGRPFAMSAEIVGVVTDAVATAPQDPAFPAWYLPLAQFDVPQFPLSSIRLSVRAQSGSPLTLVKPLETAIARVNPQLALTFQTLDGQIQTRLARERLMAQLAGFLGGLALLLASLGLYGVTSYAISKRRAEIGIRLALGAQPGGLVRLVLARASLLVCAGLAIGAATTLWATRFVGDLIFGVPVRDPATFVGAVLVLLAIGVFAAWLPARRASHLDPTVVLRES
jgi:putative ABC transport system permease protein